MTTPHYVGVTTGKYLSPDRRYIINPATLERATVRISTAAVDAGNSAFRTSYLRAGLILGKITVGGQYKQYDNAAIDGTETAVCILDEDVDLLDADGVAISTPIMANVIIKGHIDATVLIGVDAAAKVELRAAGFTLAEDF